MVETPAPSVGAVVATVHGKTSKCDGHSTVRSKTSWCIRASHAAYTPPSVTSTGTAPPVNSYAEICDSAEETGSYYPTINL